MKRVSIIGSGNVGTNSAFFIAENRSASVTLIDIREGIPVGKALDLMEAGPLRGYETAIRGSTEIKDIAGSDVVVIAAGRVRRPGERRIDLYLKNAPTVKEICGWVAQYAPQAVVINLVEPVDYLTLRAQEALAFERHRVLGIGGLLSSTRMRYLVSSALGVSPREITALVVGPHRRDMVVLRDSVRVSGVPARKLLGEERFAGVVEEVRRSGDTILDMAQHSTSYYAPSAAVAALVEAIVRDTHAILPVSVRLHWEFGLNDICLSVPCMVGGKGVEKILQVEMGEEERAEFVKAAAELKTAIERVTGQLPGETDPRRAGGKG
jgi:malate dehydrogenase